MAARKTCSLRRNLILRNSGGKRRHISRGVDSTPPRMPALFYDVATEAGDRPKPDSYGGDFPRPPRDPWSEPKRPPFRERLIDQKRERYVTLALASGILLGEKVPVANTSSGEKRRCVSKRCEKPPECFVYVWDGTLFFSSLFPSRKRLRKCMCVL